MDNDFNSSIREFVIYFLWLIALEFFSYALITKCRKKVDFETSDYEDAVVYKVSFWLCTFTLAISLGAALLLPISIISNEVLHLNPDSYYIHWLNSSLIQGLWNMTFLFSNVALFLILPFAYFFTESQGFPGSHQGIKARIYETFCVLALLAVLTLGMMYLMSAIFDYNSFNIPFFSVWHYYLPFLYSCVSFLGVLMLLLCTPVGFAHLFTVVGKLVMNPTLLSNTQLKHTAISIDDGNVLLTLDKMLDYSTNATVWSGHKHEMQIQEDNEKTLKENGQCSQKKELEELKRLFTISAEFKRRMSKTRLRRNVCYPAAMMCLLAFTVISVLIVAQNTLALCFGIKTLPVYSQKFSLGISSLSALGPLGAIFEICLILYLWCSSIVGFYALPLFCCIKPKPQETPMIHIIGNCAVLLILSSALPVLARTLGITNFDLLGDFGRIHWLGNFYIVLFYNIVFGGATAFCLLTKMTAAVREELALRLRFLTNINFQQAALLHNTLTSKTFLKED